MREDIIERLVLAAIRSPHVDRIAMKALLRASELLGMALGVRLARLRDSDDPMQQLFADSEANAAYAKLMSERADILAERWDRIPERRRPHYRPLHRYRILRLKKLLALSTQEIAHLFRIAPSTVTRWELSTVDQPETDPASATVTPTPPVRRYADVVRELVRSMALLGFGGSKSIAQTLARAGWRLSERTVSRILQEKNGAPSPTSNVEPHDGIVSALYPKHTILMDITDVPSLFGLFRFKLAVVLDGFSRMPLAATVFSADPSSSQLARLLRYAVKRFGPVRQLITDKGSQFTASGFRGAVDKLAIQHRFGAVGQKGSIALIERFWRTVKQLLRASSRPPLTKRALEQRLRPVLFHYTFVRPHQGLDGQTPVERFYELTPANEHALPPPRARPREGPTEHPFLRIPRPRGVATIHRSTSRLKTEH